MATFRDISPWLSSICAIAGVLTLAGCAGASSERKSALSEMQAAATRTGPTQPPPLWDSALSAQGADLLVNLGDRILLGTIDAEGDHYLYGFSPELRFGPLRMIDAKSGRVLWQKERRDVFRSVISVEPTIIVRGEERDGSFSYQGLDPKTGATVLEQRARPSHSFRVTTSPDALVIAEPSVTGATDLRAIALKDGAVTWTRTVAGVQPPTSQAQPPSPEVAPVRLIQSGSQLIVLGSAVTALDSSTGQPRWTVGLKGHFRGSTKAVLYGPNLYLGTDESLSVLSVQDGRYLWQKAADTEPVVLEPSGQALLDLRHRHTSSGESDVLTAVDPRSGQPRWDHPLTDAIHGTLLVAQDAAYYTTMTRLVGVSMATGARIFEQSLELPGTAVDLPDLLFARKQYVVVVRESGIAAFSVPGGDPAWTVKDYRGERFTQAEMQHVAPQGSAAAPAQAGAKEAPVALPKPPANPPTGFAVQPLPRPTKPSYLQAAQDWTRQSHQSGAATPFGTSVYRYEAHVTKSWESSERTAATLNLVGAGVQAAASAFAAVYQAYQMKKMQERLTSWIILATLQEMAMYYGSTSGPWCIRPFERDTGWGIIAVDLDTGRSAELLLTPSGPGNVAHSVMIRLHPPLFAMDPEQHTLYGLGSGMSLSQRPTYLRRLGSNDWVVPYPTIMAFDLGRLHLVEPGQQRRPAECQDMVPAAKSGDIKSMTRMLNGGADVNCVGGSGSPLAVAIGARQAEMARFLVEHGADPNGPSYGGKVLDLAVASRQVEMVKLLLEHGADPHGVNAILIDMIRKQNELEIIRILQEAGSRP
jgi:outer membrane protein assembly factor BamB